MRRKDCFPLVTMALSDTLMSILTDPQSHGSIRVSLQRAPGRVDSRLRGNDKWVAACMSLAVNAE